ncbi:MAG TPA: hypothetical protein VGR39_00580, partial [Candidatus Acidoferrales bacterium]|nr:hypothetical protein [Candidatus Acidoferrales bacterium]
MNSKIKLAMFLAAFFVVATCNMRAAYAAPPADTCSLLTPAEVSAALEVPAAGKSFGPNLCIWVQTGVKPGSPRRRVNVGILIMQGY